MNIHGSTKLAAIFCLILSLGQCMTGKDLDYVASYIVTLQDAGYETIFSLFNLSHSASDKEIARQQAKLIKQCYLAKMKKNPMPVGKGLTEVQAKVLIVNGHKVLTEKPLRSVYNWILNEAHPGFMENFRAQSKKRERATIYAPSLISLLVSVSFSLIVFDFLRVYLPLYTEKKKAVVLTKKQKKSLQKSTVSKPGVTDLYIYKGYRAFYRIVSKICKNNSQVKSE